jgi:DNA-binding IclR family transcriptional regulator
VSQTFLKGLALLQALDVGPMTVSELAQRLGYDKATVSRLVAAAELDGWVTRTGRDLTVGPRAALLGMTTPASRAARNAEPLVQALAGVTGLVAQALGLVGSRAVGLAAAGLGGLVPNGLSVSFPLWASAGGKVIAAQIDDQQLDRLLPPDPFPDRGALLAGVAPPDLLQRFFASYHVDIEPLAAFSTSGTAVRSRGALRAQLADIRRDGQFVDHQEIHPDLTCIAVRWPGPDLPAAFVCIGLSREVTDNLSLIEAALRAASGPGASRADIAQAAAARR